MVHPVDMDNFFEQYLDHIGYALEKAVLTQAVGT
ncbi:hypothetical protein SDC9_197643 [bioreactor metagenome]|uniref:Uncharacterized protein n=1 Tax=bioreactor metagenome TaxID=1076179 RepID=A0A645IFD6_9ZZZZ